MFDRRALIAAIALSVIIVAQPTYAQDKSIVVASTTSTQDSGLFEYRGNSGTRGHHADVFERGLSTKAGNWVSGFRTSD